MFSFSFINLSQLIFLFIIIDAFDRLLFDDIGIALT